MQIANHTLAICSWSIRATDPLQIVQSCESLKLSDVHLAVGPLLNRSAAAIGRMRKQFDDGGIGLTATMINFPGEDYSTLASIRATGGLVPDAAWTNRRTDAIQAIEITRQLGVNRLSTHAGFIPQPTDDPGGYARILDRVREIASIAHTAGIALLLETGQESAALLLRFLNDVNVPPLAANFDPANMILYGAGDPIAALRLLAGRIGHVHVKDAVASPQPGIQWGTETAIGGGSVDWPLFLRTLREIGYTGALAIERESRGNHDDEIQQTIAKLEAL